jgi:hypothetical protein
MMGQPRFSDLWQNYPFSNKKDGGSPQEVKILIGGRVNMDWITNTCAIRISRALNYSGHIIPADYKDNWAVTGGDGKWYAYRVKDMKGYIKKAFGQPSITCTSHKNFASTPQQFIKRRGIIVFDVSGWRDATGHITLWNGTTCSDKCYFSEAHEVSLWELP